MSDDPFKVTSQESSFELHQEDEWYKGDLTDIEYEKEGKYGPQFKWIYKLDDDDDDRTVFDWTTTKLTTDKRNKLRKRLKGLTGENPDTFDEAVDVRDFIGDRVKLMFERYESGDDEKEKVAAVKGVG